MRDTENLTDTIVVGPDKVNLLAQKFDLDLDPKGVKGLNVIRMTMLSPNTFGHLVRMATPPSRLVSQVERCTVDGRAEWLCSQ